MDERLRKDRPWSEYPIGTRAYSVGGGYWIRVEKGWKWFVGGIYPTPGGDAIGRCIELPSGGAPAMTTPNRPPQGEVE